MAGIFNFLKRFAPGDPVKRFCSASHHNRVANILEDVQGVGCRILKPTDREGRGWRVVVDGSSDVTLPNGFPTIASMGFPYGSTKWLWGVDIAGAVVTVGAGAIMYNGAVRTCSSANVTVTENTQYIAWKYTLSSNTLAVDTTLTTSPSVAETGILRGTLYEVTSTLSGSTRTITNVQPWQYNFAVAPFVPAGSSSNLYLKWNDTNKVWTVYTGTSGSFVTSIQYDESTHKLQFKKTTVICLSANAEDSTWTDITTATSHAAEHE